MGAARIAPGLICVRMRVAVNASVYDGRPSGLGAYTRGILRALHALDGDLLVFTSRPRALPSGRPILPLGEPSRGLAGHAWRLLWSQTSLPLRTRRAGAQVLLNTVPEGPVWPAIPQVTVVHDVLPLFFPADLPRQQWYFRHFVPAVLRASRVVVTDSAQTRRDVLDRYGLDPERVVVVVPGVDHERFRPVSTGAAPPFGLGRYLLYVGNLLPHKNLPLLLAAFSKVRGDVDLVIAGYRDPRYWPNLAHHARSYGIEQRVKFLDFVPGDALPALYAGALVVTVPSLYEGFGLPVVEAMACGAAVVASTTGGLQEAAGDAALLVDPRDERALAQALQRVVDDDGLRRALRGRGLAHAAQFTWQATARGMWAAIGQALANSP